VKVALAGFGADCTRHADPFHLAAEPTTGPLLLNAPTASQFVGDAHDTASADSGLGIVWAVQRVPFQLSAPPGPTASQKLVDTHDTDLTPPVPGTTCTRQEVPFQRSANVAADESLPPPASQNVVVKQETAFSLTELAPGGLAGCCKRQEVPFHLSASVKVSPTPSWNEPTASQNVAEVQDT
jgi:hypothetical protein